MVEYKEIHYDTVITEFGYKDEALHVHFRPGQKLKPKFESIDSVLDKNLERTFRKPVEETGKIINEGLEKLDSKIQYSPKEDEKIDWGHPFKKSMYFNRRLPQTKPEEFQQAQEASTELLKLYDCKDVIHKTYTKDLGGRSWDDLRSWGYVIYHTTPFIDELMLDLCKRVDEELS